MPTSQVPFPPTILESFQTALPRYTGDDFQGDLPDGGNSTMEMQPPAFWYNLEKFWETRGGEKLNQHSRLLGHLEKEFIYKPEDAISLLVEGDVTRAAAMYLLHPVNQVLSAIRPGIKCLSEHTTKNIRTDVCYKVGNSTVAVVEFKRKGAIRPHEFAAAQRQVKSGTRDWNKQLALAHDTRYGTFFAGNSLRLMKQASNYAYTERTRHVALFDWNYLVLINFHETNRDEDFVGNTCRIQIIEDPAEMRLALLGFLAMAG
ncbi:hypothetical protein F5B22DRAFT_109559 [Xylaria bambusicola]|uniref:uncharacterized protein n=1 Tax=Xylaria bambusicola TaxID=326684 RepID=UPI0020077048|nr:uncharacterized protein F5B22DRAFT_109559 [Xylaria bambusicola]KAI0517547.1 hypothetical protein F5B22DRAFT_109559 [Xylaria bambusicola]